MDKIRRSSFSPLQADVRPARIWTDEDYDLSWHVKDKRVSQLLLLLQQIQEATGSFGALPKSERTEILCSAVRLSGFTDSMEAQEVMATVLNTLETCAFSFPESP